MVHSSFNCFLRLRLLFVSICFIICNSVFSFRFKYLLRIIFCINIYIPLLSISRIRGHRFPLILELSDLFPRFWWKNKILHFFQGFVTHIYLKFAISQPLVGTRGSMSALNHEMGEIPYNFWHAYRTYERSLSLTWHAT